jgi:hypothetical protein
MIIDLKGNLKMINEESEKLWILNFIKYGEILFIIEFLCIENKK